MSYSQDQQEQMIENCNGFRFCTDCESLCLPDRAGLNINEIIFKCIACGDRTFLIRNDDPDDRIIKQNKMLQSEAADINDPELGKDPSMPRTKRRCPWCGFEEAVYYYKAGQEQKNIVIQYICNSEECRVQIRQGVERTRYWTKEDEKEIEEDEFDDFGDDPNIDA